MSSTDYYRIKNEILWNLEPETKISRTALFYLFKTPVVHQVIWDLLDAGILKCYDYDTDLLQLRT